MRKLNCFLWLKSIALSLCLISLPSLLVQAESEQNDKEDTSSNEKIVFLDSFEPPGDDKPKDTGVGGSRNGAKCNANEQPIRALMPQGNYGLTSKAQPNIYLYLPQTSATQAVLSFQDEAGTKYARAFLPIETDLDIASFALPKAKMPLQAGKNYQWKISIVCGEYLKPGDPTFTGWVQRVKSTDTQKQLGFDTTNEQIRSLAEQGYWYDMLDAISLYAKQYPLRRQRFANVTSNHLDIWQQIIDLSFHYKP